VLPAWQVTAATLPGIHDHFWDWMLWLAAKQQAGKAGLVAAELAKLHEHLLAPLGVRAQPATPAQAIGSYRAARRRQEHRLNCQVPPRRRAGRQPGTAVDGGPPGSPRGAQDDRYDQPRHMNRSTGSARSPACQSETL
jgi:hypothetical protein